MTRRLPFAAAALAVVTFAATVGITTVATTTRASAVDASCTGPGNMAVCFWDAYTHDDPNPARPYQADGSRAVETVPLTQFASHHQIIKLGGYQNEPVEILGKISYLANSHYHNPVGRGTPNDTISFVVNNTPDCLMLFNDRDFQGGKPYKVSMIGPRSAYALTGGDLANANNVFSSAALIVPNANGELHNAMCAFMKPQTEKGNV